MVRIAVFATIGVAVYLLWRPPNERWPVVRRWGPVAAAILFALLYLRSPIDLIPDYSAVGFVDDLLVFVAVLYWARGALRQAPRAIDREPRASDTEDDARDPHEVLGIPRGASKEELSRAYREQMKLYHPDRVSGLGDELQRVAHRKTLEIQAAYERLRGG